MKTGKTGRRAALVAIAAMWLAPWVQAAELEVVGISLGMPEAEAAKKLRLHNNSMKVTPQKAVVFEALPQEPMTFSVTGTSFAGTSEDYSNDNFDITLSGAPAPSRVLAVSRSLANQKGISRANLLASLRKKYGTETKQKATARDQVQLIWMVDAAGKPASWGGDALFDCGRIRAKAGYNYRPYTGNTAMSEVDAACGTVVAALLSLHPQNAELVTRMDITLADHAAWLKSIDDLGAYLGAANTRLQAEKARAANASGAPKL